MIIIFNKSMNCCVDNYELNYKFLNCLKIVFFESYSTHFIFEIITG
jgi:hypothetical protein